MKTRPCLRFRWLNIERLPGFEDGGFRLEDLSEGINIIHGPNASGKTSAARGLQWILWPNRSQGARHSLRAGLEQDGAEWSLEVDNGYLRCFREGREAQPPVLPPAEMSRIYNLSLHELLATEDRPLAEMIRKESSGGIDIRRAAEKLYLHQGPPGRNKSEVAALRQAEDAILEARQTQEELSQRQHQLSSLIQQKEAARGAVQQIPFLQKALEYHQLRRRQTEVSRQLKSYPAGVGKLVGDEIQRLQEWHQELEEYREKEREARAQLRACQARIEEANLPANGDHRLKLREIEAFRDQLVEHGRELETRERELRTTQEELESALQRIHPQASADRLKNLDFSRLEGLSDLLARAEKLRAERATLEALRRWVGENTEPVYTERLERGRRALLDWIQASAGDPGRGLRFLLALLCLTTLGAAVSLALNRNWPGLAAASVAALVAAGLLIHSLRRPSREQYQNHYASQGLAVPSSWTPAAVQETFQETDAALVQARVAQEKKGFWQAKAPSEKELRAQEEEFDRARNEMAVQIGVAPELEVLQLQWVASSLQEWQRDQKRLRQAEIKTEYARSQFDRTLKKLGELLKSHGYDPPADLPASRAAVAGLAERVRLYEAALRDRDEADRSLREHLLPHQKSLDAKEAELFDRVGIEDRDESQLKALLDRFRDYQSDVQELSHVERDLGRLQSELGENAGLLEDSPDLLEERLRISEERREELDRLTEEIAQIETLVGERKKGRELEEALAHRDEAAEKLKDLRREHLFSVAGGVLLERLKRESYGKSLPPVFKNAQAFFARITRGNFGLVFSETDPPEFGVVDTRSERGRRLDQLSSGTRVQLLMAVRLAFIHSQEQTTALPLVLDETLANSDDVRARGLIEAAIEVARQGRQVFYFTAQHDEVGKWISLLNQGDGEPVPYKLIDLGHLRRLEESDEKPLPRQTPPEVRVPEPGSASHEEYGRQLGVPRLDPLRDSVGGCHLWYLIEDTGLLYRLLQQHISTWGQLNNLSQLQLGGLLSGLSSPELLRIKAAARVVDSTLKALRAGRGKAVTPAVIRESDILTSQRLIDETGALAEQVEGDARQLIRCLQEGVVKGFRRASLERLTDYLREEGYLASRPPLGAAEVQEQVLSALHQELQLKHITLERIHELVSLLQVCLPLADSGASGSTTADPSPE